MKKFIILSLVFVFVLSMTSFASRSRIRTMGNSPISVIDDSNIELFPSRLIQFQNLAVGEFVSNEFTRFGMNWKVSDRANWTMGAHFTTMDEAASRADSNFNMIPNFGMYPLEYNDRISLFYARDLGANKFGLNIDYSSAGAEHTDTVSTNSDHKESLSLINLTVGLTEASDKWDVALNFGFGTFTNEVNDSAQNEADGISTLGLTGRFFSIRNPNYTLIPHASISTEKFGWKDTGADFAVKYSRSNIELGCAVNFTPSSDVLGVLDFGIALESDKDETTSAGTTVENKNSTTTLPFFKLGLDAKVFKWLDFRAGVQSDWHREKDEMAASLAEWKYSYASNETMVGLGFNWNNLHIDTEANPAFFVSGPHFLSGNEEDMAWSLSATYDL